MNIVYALSGEGRGHGSTARAILPVLQAAGHRVKVISYGQSVAQLAGYDLLPIRGIRHAYDEQGRLSLLRSAIRNHGIAAYYLRYWTPIRRRLRSFNPDVFIVNFEPLSARLARSLGVPIISFDNQHALVHAPHAVPRELRWSAWLTTTAIRLGVPRAAHYVVMAFGPLVVNDPRVSVVPPVIQDEYRKLKPAPGPRSLVYLKHPNPGLLEVLKRTSEEYLVYGYDVSATDRNLVFRPHGDQMPSEFAAARAVIGTAGMSLISEAIWLRKPFFAVPLKNEYEQTWNARRIRELGFGDFSENPSPPDLDRFFARQAEYRQSIEARRFDPDAATRRLLELVDDLPARLPRDTG